MRGLENWMHWSWHNTAHTEKKVYEQCWGFVFSDSISPRHTRKLKNTKFSTLNSYENRRSRSMWNLVETMLKTKGEKRCTSHYPIRRQSRDITEARFHICQVITTKKRKNGISAMPRSILRISIWNFNVVFGPNVHTNGKPGLYIYIFHSSYGRFCIFRIFISAISLGQKKKEKKAWLLVCWFVHNQHRVKKSHPNTLYWAGHGQSTSLAATWLAHLVPKL